MLSQCPQCGLSKSSGAMGSVLPQCRCDWKMPTQHTWQGLTDEEQSFIYDQVKQIVNSKPFWVRFADAIEAKLKEKNNA